MYQYRTQKMFRLLLVRNKKRRGSISTLSQMHFRPESFTRVETWYSSYHMVPLRTELIRTFSGVKKLNLRMCKKPDDVPDDRCAPKMLFLELKIGHINPCRCYFGCIFCTRRIFKRFDTTCTRAITIATSVTTEKMRVSIMFHRCLFALVQPSCRKGPSSLSANLPLISS